MLCLHIKSCINFTLTQVLCTSFLVSHLLPTTRRRFSEQDTTVRSLLLVVCYVATHACSSHLMQSHPSLVPWPFPFLRAFSARE